MWSQIALQRRNSRVPISRQIKLSQGYDHLKRSGTKVRVFYFAFVFNGSDVHIGLSPNCMPLLQETGSPSWENNRLDWRTKCQDSFFIHESAPYGIARRLLSTAVASQDTYMWSLQYGRLKVDGLLTWQLGVPMLLGEQCGSCISLCALSSEVIYNDTSVNLYWLTQWETYPESRGADLLPYKGRNV